MKRISVSHAECTQLVNGNFANSLLLIKAYTIAVSPYANDKQVLKVRIIFKAQRTDTLFEVYVSEDALTAIAPFRLYEAFEVVETEPGVYTPHDIATYGRISDDRFNYLRMAV